MRAILLISVLVSAHIVDAQADTDRQSAEKLWEAAISAKGGRERLRAVKNMVRADEFKYQHLGVFRRPIVYDEYLMQLPDKVWHWSDQRSTVFGLRVHLHDLTNDISYLSYPGEATPRKLSDTGWGEYWLTSTQAFALMESKWFKPELVRIISCEKHEGVQTRYADQQIDFCFDKRTHLPNKVVLYKKSGWKPSKYDSNPVEATFILEDYRPVSGIMLPHIVIEITHLKLKRRVSYELNVKYDSGFFKQLPSADAGPRPWRPNPQ